MFENFSNYIFLNFKIIFSKFCLRCLNMYIFMYLFNIQKLGFHYSLTTPHLNRENKFLKLILTQEIGQPCLLKEKFKRVIWEKIIRDFFYLK